MANTNKLLSDDPAILAGALQDAINTHASSDRVEAAKTGLAYYAGRHEILDNRIFYIDGDGHVREDKYSTNTRIPHPFLTELIDQKTTYLLANPVKLSTGDDAAFQEHIDEYIDETFQVTLQTLLSGAAKKGAEYLFARTTSEDKLTFQTASSISTFPVFNEDFEVERIVRSYSVPGVTNESGVAVTVVRAEVWTKDEVYFFVSKNGERFRPDPAVEMNPRKHVIAHVLDDDGAKTDEVIGRGYGVLPFFRLSNNESESTDLAPVKTIIDDYDLMNAYLSNNLQDFADVLYVVKGYPGNDLNELKQNLRTKKIASVDSEGGVDVRTVEIPVEGRTRKMDIDRENIYRFGMGFDSTQVGDGNITNVVIKSRYALLNMKASKSETRLRAALRWVSRMITDDIERRTGKKFDPNEISFEFERDQLVSATDDAQVEMTLAQAQAIKLNTILAAAARIDDQTTLQLIAETLGVDWEAIQKALAEDGVEPLDPTASGADPLAPAPGEGAPAQNEGVPTVTEATDIAEEVKGAPLNGAQTKALRETLADLKAGNLTRGQALQIIMRSLSLSREDAAAIIDGTE